MSVIVFTILLLICGAVDIPSGDVFNILIGDENIKKSWKIIVLESRLPLALTSMICGAALSVSGLMLQTTFRNPLAGPSIMGISAGASLGVAIALLALGASAGPLGSMIGAFAGAAIILVIISFLSSVLKNSLGLLIVGIMISYLANSIVSLLNFFASAEGIRNFTLWGMGSFSSVTLTELPWLMTCIIVALLIAIFLAKPLNAMLLGDRYMTTMGYNIQLIRTTLLGISGMLTAVVTAFCGPIGFIGLVVPHIARMLFATSMHNILLPASALLGAAIAQLCALIAILPSNFGMIPVNVITPIIGVPIIVYIMVNSRKLKYFN